MKRTKNKSIEVKSSFDLICSDCKKEEIKENGFKISFGVSIIILGVVSIFFDINNTILVGISLSALIFTLIDAIPSHNNLLYIFPLAVLLLFCVYPDLPFIKLFLESRFNNFIVFVSFGASFCLNSYVSFCNRLHSSKIKLEDDLKHQKDVESQLENAIIILSKVFKLKKLYNDNKNNALKIDEVLDELCKYVDEEKRNALIKKDMVNLGIKNNTQKFSIKEVQDIINKNSSFRKSINNINYEELNDKNKD